VCPRKSRLAPRTLQETGADFKSGRTQPVAKMIYLAREAPPSYLFIPNTKEIFCFPQLYSIKNPSRSVFIYEGQNSSG